MAKDLSANLDLNLLRTLLIIYQERNLRKAAERLFVTQPALSHALQKLRHHFNDDLFSKTQGGLAPTPYAIELCSHLEPALGSLFDAINSQQAFEPSELTGKLQIALAPQYLAAYGCKIYRAIAQQAPTLSLSLVKWTSTTFEDIANGKTQMGINYDIPHTKKTLYRRNLSPGYATIYARRDHPYHGATIDAHQSVPYPWASLIIPDRNEHVTDLETYLAQYGITPTINFRSTSPEVILDALRHSDMLFPSIDGLVRDDDPTIRKIIPVTNGEYHQFHTVCFYSQTQHNAPLMQWLCNIVDTTCHPS
ncbi:hypothetical protein ABT56_10870 [Photobacterium aquae]|uniref:HTH lysR-type domain-containing protein n=1 Tax=Photobacterium aquae TaxID=1195763 RepID=A0A0J1H2D9_9GAMM|nr:LysR family transcriptional regulator [Photobacterium aquae]KLV06014.1 hypothetical protein ABT56_10870 [Photobacterium aquae]